MERLVAEGDIGVLLVVWVEQLPGIKSYTYHFGLERIGAEDPEPRFDGATKPPEALGLYELALGWSVLRIEGSLKKVNGQRMFSFDLNLLVQENIKAEVQSKAEEKKEEAEAEAKEEEKARAEKKAKKREEREKKREEREKRDRWKIWKKWTRGTKGATRMRRTRSQSGVAGEEGTWQGHEREEVDSSDSDYSDDDSSDGNDEEGGRWVRSCNLNFDWLGGLRMAGPAILRVLGIGGILTLLTIIIGFGKQNGLWYLLSIPVVLLVLVLVLFGWIDEF